MAIIEFENLSICYGSFQAFQAREIVLCAGAIGLLGPNGAGKSTLIKVILGLLPPRTGSGKVLGFDVIRESRAIRRRVGYMPENDSLIPGLTAVRFVSLAGELAGMRARDALRRAHEVLTYLDLEEARYRKLEEYSAGMRQRIKLAQALVHDPELLILDEPTNGLDPGGRTAMLDLVRTLNRDFKKSVILATHLLEDVDSVCDSLLVLDEGRAIAQGRIDAMRAHWKDRYRVQIDGNPRSFIEGLTRAGGAVLSMDDDRSSSGEIIIRVPDGWGGRHILELIAAVGDDEAAPILRSLRPDRERLGQLFSRIVQDGSRTPDSEAGVVGGGTNGNLRA